MGLTFEPEIWDKLLAASPSDATRLCRHFRMFATAEAGAAEANDAFEVAALARAIGVFDRLFDLLERGAACRFPGRKVVVRSAPERAVLVQRLCERLAAQLTQLEVTREPLEQTYYDRLRFMFHATSRSGDSIPIGDGGLFDWVEKLTSSRRFRFVASGFGLQLAPVLFADGQMRGSQQP